MKIALIGATGFVGTALVAELLQRGHQVTALVRNPARLDAQPGLAARALDAHDPDAVAAAVKGHDAVISAFNPGWDDPALYDRFMSGSQAIVGGVEQSGVRRLLVVGGAGSLFAAPGLKVIDTPNFPDAYRAEASAGGVFLDALRNEKELDWTFLSPSAEFVEGERTGKFRLGKDDLLVSAEGRSWKIGRASCRERV